MKIKFRILPLILASLFCAKIILFAVTTYFYVNENETLTELCCVNKETDATCKAKCFLDKTEENSQDKEKSSSSIHLDYFENIAFSLIATSPNFKLREDNFNVFLREPVRTLSLLDKPPVV